MTDAKLFIVVYSLVGAYFSSKMIRLVLLLSPAACVNSGAFIGGLVQILLDAHAEIISGGATATATATATVTDAGAAVRAGSSSSAPKKSAGGGGGGGGTTNPNPKKGTKEAGRAVPGARPGTGAGGGGDGGDGDPTPLSSPLRSELAELQQLWEENVEMRRSCPLMTLGMVCILP